MSATHNVTVTGYDEALLRLLDLATNDNAVAVAINAGGTGYVIGDILTVTGGTIINSLVTTLEVTSVAAGVIDGIRIFNTGAYSAQPGNPVSHTGGTGTGATFNLTFEVQNWTINRNVASSTSAVDNPTVAGGGFAFVGMLSLAIELAPPAYETTIDAASAAAADGVVACR